MAARRDYGLLGEEGRLAVERGLANGEWYRSPVDRKRMKQLMQRSDGRAIRDTVVWLALIAGLGAAIVLSWFHWWSLLLMVPYGMLWSLGGDSRCHESCHGTAFRTFWLNELVFQISCFMTLREPIVRRWDHTRHHTDTIIVGRDREIIEERPPRPVHLVLLFTGVPMAYEQLRGLFRHVVGRISEEERLVIPQTEFRRMIRQARLIFVVHIGIVLLAVALGTTLPIVLTSFATLFGAWAIFLVGLTQHVGLAEDVLDFRLNTRTVHMNGFWRFLYWNMNYHLEHHMFPMVPFHSLPALHEDIRADCPPPYRGIVHVYRSEIIPVLRGQRKDPGLYVHRPLPAPSTDVSHTPPSSTRGRS
jgi:fatty acid desaturase